MITGRPWSREESEKLRSMLDEKCTHAEIADALGRTEGSIKGHIKWMIERGQLERPKGRPRWTAEEDAALKKMAAEGATSHQIADALGRVTEGVRHRSLRLNVKLSDWAVWSLDEIQTLREMAAEGNNVKTIAAALQRSYFGVKSKLRALGINIESRQTLCWDCANACPRTCEWAGNFEPVPGWDAVPNGNSYHVITCPKYQEG